MAVQKWSFRRFQSQVAIKILLFLFLKQLCFANKPFQVSNTQELKYLSLSSSLTCNINLVAWKYHFLEVMKLFIGDYKNSERKPARFFPRCQWLAEVSKIDDEKKSKIAES